MVRSTPRSACSFSPPISYVFQSPSARMAMPWSTRSWRKLSVETARSGIPQFLSPAGIRKLIFVRLGRGIVDFDARGRLERAQRFVTSGDDLVAFLQAADDFNVGHS